MLPGHFDAHKEISKYKLDHSTFDLIDIVRFRNTNWLTIFGYLWVWAWVFLLWILLGVDIYTCLNILVFHHWSNDDYKPYAYSVAKWIFTGCIIFQFALLLYHWVWAIHTYRTRNIALAYVNAIARILYTVKSYDYHCLFHKIDTDNAFDWACFLAYEELDNALQIVVADTPRQVINILTLRYYATDGDLSNDIIANIKEIATSNLTLSIILSFMCLSLIIWSIFFFRFLLGMLCYIPVKIKLRKKGFKSLKKYCCKVVNDNVRTLVLKHHKPKNELLEQGILDLQELKENPLLNDSVSRFDTSRDFDYAPVPAAPAYNDNKKLYDAYSMKDLKNPFGDHNKAVSKESLVSSGSNEANEPARPVAGYTRPEYRNPFNDSSASLTHSLSQASLVPSLKNPSLVGRQPVRNYSSGTLESRNYSSGSIQPFSRNLSAGAIDPPRNYSSGSLESLRNVNQVPLLHSNHSQTSLTSHSHLNEYARKDSGFSRRDTLPEPNLSVLSRKSPPPSEYDPVTGKKSEDSVPYPLRGVSFYENMDFNSIQLQMSLYAELNLEKKTEKPFAKLSLENSSTGYPERDLIDEEPTESVYPTHDPLSKRT